VRAGVTTEHPLGCDRGRATARGAQQRHPLEPDVVDQRLQQRDLMLERQVVLAHRMVGPAHPELVVADQREPSRQRLPEAHDAFIAPLELQVAHPPRRRDQRRGDGCVQPAEAGYRNVEYKKKDLIGKKMRDNH